MFQDMIQQQKRKKWVIKGILFFLAIIVLFPSKIYGQELQTGGNGLATRIAPGESLPLMIRLSNFGNNERVDVTIQYEILDTKGLVIVVQTETVAVQTSASFITKVPLPNTIAPGPYTARTKILYNEQQVPATATQQFTVERKIFGIFFSDLVIYAAILLIVILLLLLLIFLLRRHRKQSVFEPIDYSHVSREKRIYYQIISDIIQQMRYHEGDAAVTLISNIPGLVIDADSGKVLVLTHVPSEIIATIVSRYEKAFGKHVNLSFADDGESRAIIR